MHAQGVVPPVRLSGGNLSAEQLAPPAPHVTECTRWLHARPPRNSAIHARIGSLSRALLRPRVAQRGCWLYLVRAAQRLALGLVLFIGRARRRGVRACEYSHGRDEKCQGQP